MRRQCARSGCSAFAAATFTFDSNDLTVWLDVPRDGGARAGDLCDRHARTLTAPRGWRVHDRRDAPDGERAPEPDRPEPTATDPAPELHALMHPQTPLLARAFEAAGTV